MTELEKKIRAKIPGPDTGIEIRHSICDICTPGAHCGLDVYVKDSKILKVEGTKGFPGLQRKAVHQGGQQPAIRLPEEPAEIPHAPHRPSGQRSV